jgi:hypothetical protein
MIIMYRNATAAFLCIVLTGASIALSVTAEGRTWLPPVADGPGTSVCSNQGAEQPVAPSVCSRITRLSPDSAACGETVTISGRDFGGSRGYVVLTGLRIDAAYWSDSTITFLVPEDGASGPVYIRNGSNGKSNNAAFTVERNLPGGQFEPDGFDLVDVGLPGAAFLVETDGEYLYGVSGFERLVTYRIREGEPYEQCGCVYLPQRIGDLRILNGCLYVAGDHGLRIYRCSDLQAGKDRFLAAVAGRSFITCDAKEKKGIPVDGTLVALCEYRPRGDSGELVVPLYLFDSRELVKLGSFRRSVTRVTERQIALAIDPLNPKVYVSGCETLLGNDKYLLEVDVADPANPLLIHTESTGSLTLFDMDAASDRLWAGVSSTGFIFFEAFQLQAGAAHLVSDETVNGAFGFGRTTRVKIVDGAITVGSAWLGARPDVLLLRTFNNGPSFQADAGTVDWAFDVTGFPEQTANHDGKIIVADEWGGFLTYNYCGEPNFSVEHEPEHQVMAGAMTEGLHIAGDRIYIAGRGAGPWSADRFDLADETSWRRVDWDWSANDPQPYPVCGLCTRIDPEQGLLIAGLGHDKAMAWGDKSYGILYRETSDSITQLALSAEFDPPGIYGSGVDTEWPEPDLVFMTTGSDGIRAFVIDPDPAAPTITIHRDCANSGFGSDVFSTAAEALYMHYYRSGAERKIVVGARLGLFSSAPGLYVFDVQYANGVPDRDFPDRSIVVTKEHELLCMRSKTVEQFDMTDSGLIAAATSQGLAVFHISWIPVLNAMGDFAAWNLIKVPAAEYAPWWDTSWFQSFHDACFKDENTLYVVKKPQGIWKVELTVDWVNHTHDCTATAYYPGVECGIDYGNLLTGWGNPDIVTLHHPYGVVTDGCSAYVTGWSGKVYRLSPPNDFCDE